MARTSGKMQRYLRAGYVASLFCLLIVFVVFNPKRWTEVPASHNPAAPSYCPKTWQDLYMAEQAHISRTLVIASLKNESTQWIREAFWDIVEPRGPLQVVTYLVDAEDELVYHPPINKGHEANVYLSYMIDAYDALPDVALFMHAHQITWHNKKLLDDDSSLMVRNLDLQKVLDQGYVNLRCHWDPGCPDWIHPTNTDFDGIKEEEHLIAQAWTEIFGPEAAVPHTLAQPCCSQFALSREAIRSLPKERYMQFRDWLYETQLPDSVSGRIFEYLWHFIFLSTTEYCIPQEECYCQQYGVCFDHSRNTFDRWFSLEQQHGDFSDELRRIEEKENEYYGHCRPVFSSYPMVYDCEDRKFALESRIQFLEIEKDKRARAAFDLGRGRRGIHEYCGDLGFP